MLPRKIKISEDDKLTITWDNGTESKIGLDYLREECPCAECKGENIFFDNRLPFKSSAFDQTNEVTGIKVVGSYAIQVSWKDGHDKGIYNWEYLLELAEGENENLKQKYKPLI